MKLKNSLQHKQSNSTAISRGFTIVELAVVIVVIGILASIAIIGYGSWRSSLASNEVKSDLTAAASAMENARNFGSGYPSSLPATFASSTNVTISYGSGDAKSFCLDGRSKSVAGLYFFIKSNDKAVKQGTCAGGEGSTPDWTILVYNTTMNGCSGTTINLPVTSPTSAQGSVIDWGDGNTQTLSASLQSHTYGSAGEYVVKYKGPITTFDTSGTPSAAQPCLKELRQWSSDVSPTTVSFKNSSNLQKTVQPPSSVTNYTSLFEGATSFNQDISSWDVSNVTNMQAMFSKATSFNQPIGNWNTQWVNNMRSMFAFASSFNQPIGNWNTQWVTNMQAMFYNATAFNQPLNAWNTGNVQYMGQMFSYATSFNQPIGSWNTAKVQYMNNLFDHASVFNQPIGSWNTSKVSDMTSLFDHSYAFNQDISSWNTSSVTRMDRMFADSSAFNQDLSSWNVALVSPKPPTSFDAYAGSWLRARPNWS